MDFYTCGKMRIKRIKSRDFCTFVFTYSRRVVNLLIHCNTDQIREKPHGGIRYFYT